MNVPNTKPLSPEFIIILSFHFFVIEPMHTSVDTSVDASVFMNRASFTFWLKVVWPCKNYFSKNDVASQLVV